MGKSPQLSSEAMRANEGQKRARAGSGSVPEMSDSETSGQNALLNDGFGSELDFHSACIS